MSRYCPQCGAGEGERHAEAGCPVAGPKPRPTPAEPGKWVRLRMPGKMVPRIGVVLSAARGIIRVAFLDGTEVTFPAEDPEWSCESSDMADALLWDRLTASPAYRHMEQLVVSEVVRLAVNAGGGGDAGEAGG